MVGRPGLPPGVYFRALLVGYFEGIDSERGIAWRTADSLALRSFLGFGARAVNAGSSASTIFANAPSDRCGNASQSFPVGAGHAGGRRLAERQHCLGGRNHSGSQRGVALDRIDAFGVQVRLKHAFDKRCRVTIFRLSATVRPGKRTIGIERRLTRERVGKAMFYLQAEDEQGLIGIPADRLEEGRTTPMRERSSSVRSLRGSDL